MTRWTSWLGAALIALTCGLAPLSAQTAPVTPPTAPATSEKPAPLSFAVAAGMAIVILLIACMPSRKAQ